MKTIIVKNLMLQFDDFDEGADKHNALNMLDSINEVLQQRFPDSQPQIFTNAVDDSDIEITDEGEHEKQECITSGMHLTDCDDDGFCNHCGHQ